MQRLPPLSANNYTKFEGILSCLTSGAGGGLKNGEAVRIDLVGAFRADPLRAQEDVYWEQVEEAQMLARLAGLPDGFWATLRGLGPDDDSLYFDVLRLSL